MVSKFKLNNTKSVATQEAISRTLEYANNYAGELSIEVLSLDKIELDPENPRELKLTLNDAINGIDEGDPDVEKKKQEWKSLESLAKTIRDDQLINPIFVYRYGNKCRLIAGERRTLASAIAGKKEIIARIAPQRPVGAKLRILQWIENNERADLSLAERVASIEAIIKEHTAENKKDAESIRVNSKLLSDLTGMATTQARRYFLILQSGPEIKEAINSGKLDNIKKVELLCSVNIPEHQTELLRAALSGSTIEELVKLKKALEEGQFKAKTELRGRKKSSISLGKVKPNVAKIIFDALILNTSFEKKLVEQVRDIHGKVQWTNSESIQKALKKVLGLLENGEAVRQ